MRSLDPRLLREVRAARTALVTDVGLGVGVTVAVVAQAALIAAVISWAFRGTPLGSMTSAIALLAAVVTVRTALRRARIWDWVASLPDGWDTLVGEEGGRVSGGERRRIALARTFLAGAPVLVLDEPTAHLDPPTARALMHDILAATDGRSVLLITHRTEDLHAVDEIVTLSRGRTARSVLPTHSGGSP